MNDLSGSDLSGSRIFLETFLIFVAVMANALFVAAEFSLARSRASKIKTEKNISPLIKNILLDALVALNDYISAAQIGITISSLVVGAFAESLLTDILEPILIAVLGHGDVVLMHSIAFTVSILIATCVHVIIGEFIPKTLAIQNPENIAVLTILPLHLSYKISRPFVCSLNSIALFFLSLFGIKNISHNNLTYSEEELKYLLEQSEKDGVIEQSEKEMMQNVFEFGDTVAREVMTPRTKIIGLKENTAIVEACKCVIDQKISKLPVYQDSLDHIIGVVLSVDLLDALHKEQFQKPINELIKPVLRVPENKSIASLLTDLKRDRSKLAIVIDEFGGTSGIVTLEDIIEELVGEIQDEGENLEENIKYIDTNHWEVDALVSIDEINQSLNADFSDEYFDTIGGYVFGLLGREPQKGDSVSKNGWNFTITRLNRRIEKIHVVKSDLDSQSPDTATPELLSQAEIDEINE